MSSNRSVRWQVLEQCAASVLDGHAHRWTEFMAKLDPELQVLVRYQKIGRLQGNEDTAADIVVAVFEKLSRNGHRALRGYFDRTPRPNFAAWMRRVVQSCAIDYMRTRPEFRRTAGPDEARWQSLATLTSGFAAALPGTLEQKRDQVLRDLRTAVEVAAVDGPEALAKTWRVSLVQARRVATKGSLYEPVLLRVFAGFAYPEIARELEMTTREVELIVRYIVELLTTRYGSPT